MSSKKAKAAVLISLVFVLFMSVSLFVINFENIFSILFREYTGYEISFIKWDKSFSADNSFAGLSIKSDKLKIRAEKAELFFDIKRALRRKEAFLRIELHGVTFFPAGAEAPLMNRALVGMLTGERTEYDIVKAKILSSDSLTRIEDLFAASKGLRLAGNGSFNRKTDKLSVSFKIELSPDLAMTLPEEIRDNVLSREENGWYATVIDFKGPAILVKSLYAFST